MSLLVTIIMPAYNAERLISDSIESVLSQTYTNFELIIIDDCSKDQTVKVVESFILKDNRIKLFKNIKNKGVAGARNNGLAHAKGLFVAFIDSDDLWHKQKLEKQVKLLRENINVDVTYSEYIRFNSKGLNQKVCIPIGYTNYRLLLKGDFIGNSSALYRFEKFKNIRQKKIGAEDYLFWLEIFKNKDVKGLGVNEPLMYYRVAENTGSLSSNKFKSASWVWNIYFKHLNLGFVMSLYYFSHYFVRALYKRI